MSNGIVDYHVEIDGVEVTIVLHAVDAETANALANSITMQLKHGTLAVPPEEEGG